MKIKILVIILFLFASLTIGCGVTASGSATDMTQPVLLGKIKRIQGISSEQWQLKIPFDVSFSSSKGDLYESSENTIIPHLVNIIDTAEDKVVINEVSVGSSSLLFIGIYIFGYRERGWVDIKGGIYHEPAVEHETK